MNSSLRSTSAKSSLGAAVFGAATAVLAASGCGAVDNAFCPGGNCGWSDDETARVAALSNLPDAPPVDTSNKYFGNPAAEQLGRKFFWDPRFSGTSTGMDSIKRPMPYSRAPKGQPVNIGCVACHDLKHGGVDLATVPGNLSIGGSWESVNTPTIFNDAYRPLIFWESRGDSLWSQPPGSIEASMSSTRLHSAWTIATYYRADYETVFADYPLPITNALTDIAPTLETNGQCKLSAGACPAGCRTVQDMAATATGCFPRFPVEGKPGAKMGCQPGDATEPFSDAWDCMDPADQQAILRVVVNFGKAVGAFESLLTTNHSALDKFVVDLNNGKALESTAISPAAKNGARLFVGKAGCSDCHSGPLLSDENRYNIGIPQVGEGIPTMNDCPKGGVCDCVTPNNCIPFGAYDGYAKLHKLPYVRTSAWSDNPQDTSRQRYMDMTQDSIPKGSWRTPSLRDVALTAPYMHNGAIATLEDVVDHYNNGAEPLPNGEPSARIQPLFLSTQEKGELVEFLKTLTGEPLPAEISDPPTLP